MQCACYVRDTHRSRTAIAIYGKYVWVIRFKIQLMSQSRLKCHEYASKNFFRDLNIWHKTEASIQTGIV